MCLRYLLRSQNLDVLRACYAILEDTDNCRTMPYRLCTLRLIECLQHMPLMLWKLLNMSENSVERK